MNPKMVLALIEMARQSDRTPIGYLAIDEHLTEFMAAFWDDREKDYDNLLPKERGTVEAWMRVWLDWKTM